MHCTPCWRTLQDMGSKKKWFGLAALGAAIAALVIRRKRENPEAQSTQGTIDT